MKTKAQIAEEIIALNERYDREYREAVANDPGGHYGVTVAWSDDPEVQELLRDHSLDAMYQAGVRARLRRERAIMMAILSGGDLSFGMAELLER